MTITPGMYVTHIHRTEWGVGKVLEGRTGTALRLWFEMGGEKKIGADYHDMLQESPIPLSFHVPSTTSSPLKKAMADKFHREYFSGRWEFTFSRGERERFTAGHLIRQWAAKFPFLFDDQDVDRALASQTKGRGRFFEWAAAVRLFEARGYHCLVKDYASPLDPRKQELVRQLAGEELAGSLTDATGKALFPDLLVYTPDHSEWFFCEVKAPGDVVRKAEETAFPALAEKTLKPIYLVTLSLL